MPTRPTSHPMQLEHSPIAQRLHLQHFVAPSVVEVQALVGWMGAIQAQEEHHAKTAIALRLAKGTVAAVDKAIAEARIVRTWMMRGTLHFVVAEDLWWMQQLLGEAVMRKAAGTFLLGGLDAATLATANAVLTEALQGRGPQLRTALVERLAAAGIDMKGPMSSRIFASAAYDGLICMGPTQGKQDTFVWLEDWVPRQPPMDRAMAILQLAERYFQSHGPATGDDFVAWSGLGIREVRAAMQGLPLAMETFGNQSLFTLGEAKQHYSIDDGLLLLPGFDELLIAYKDRTWLLDPAHHAQAITNNGIFRPIVVLNGKVVGTWQRKVMRDHIVVAIQLFDPALTLSLDQLQPALHRLAEIWQMAVVVAGE